MTFFWTCWNIGACAVIVGTVAAGVVSPAMLGLAAANALIAVWSMIEMR